MTTLALGAESTVVHIVLGVTTDAGLSRFERVDEGFLVAGLTIDLLVSTVQTIVGLGMIEIPGFPGAGVVAVLAFDAEAPLVLVFFLVATVAF